MLYRLAKRVYGVLLSVKIVALFRIHRKKVAVKTLWTQISTIMCENNKKENYTPHTYL